MENLDITNVDDIIKFINEPKNNEFNVNGNNIIHLLITRLDTDNDFIITTLLKKFNNLFYKINFDGYTPFFMMCRYGKYILAQKCLKIDSLLASQLSVENESILFYCADNFDFFKWCITNYNDNIDLNIVARDDHTLLTFLTDKNSKYDEIMKFIFGTKKILQKFDFNKSTTNVPVLTYSIISKNQVIFDLLINVDNIDVNIFDKHKKTPLYYAIVTNNINVVKKLVKHRNVDINYSCLTDSCNPLHVALNKKYFDIVDVLIKYNVDLDKTNSMLNNSGHIIMSMYKTLKNTKNKIFINIVNKILKNCDIRCMNINGKSVVDIINEHNFVELKNIIKKNKHFKKLNNTRKKENNQIIIPKYIKPHKQNFGLFNSNMLHSLIYNLCMIQKYDNLFMPSQYFINDKHMTDERKLSMYVDMFNTSDLLNNYIVTIHDILYELTPYVLLWNNKNNNMFPENAKIYYDNLKNSDKVRFITTKLTLITDDNVSHANILIYDKKNNILERFEPYGYYIMLDNDALDDKIYEYFKYIYNKNITYVKPKDYLNKIKFQTLSNDMNINVKKFNDPYGYCLAWTLWYLEMRLLNPEVSSQNIVTESYKNIISEYGNTQNALIDFIRDFSHTLDNAKNNFLLKEIKINKNNLYDVSLSSNEKIIKKIMDWFNKAKHDKL